MQNLVPASYSFPHFGHFTFEGAVRGVPQEGQNFAPEFTCVPHLGHTGLVARLAPHSAQNFPGATLFPQDGQTTVEIAGVRACAC